MLFSDRAEKHSTDTIADERTRCFLTNSRACTDPDSFTKIFRYVLY